MNLRNMLPGWIGRRELVRRQDPDACWTVLPTGTVYGGFDLPRGPNELVKLPDTNAHGYRLRLWFKRDQIPLLVRTLREAADRLEVLNHG